MTKIQTRGNKMEAGDRGENPCFLGQVRSAPRPPPLPRVRVHRLQRKES